jgi:hypothetical protein
MRRTLRQRTKIKAEKIEHKMFGVRDYSYTFSQKLLDGHFALEIMSGIEDIKKTKTHPSFHIPYYLRGQISALCGNVKIVQMALRETQASAVKTTELGVRREENRRERQAFLVKQKGQGATIQEKQTCSKSCEFEKA